MHEFGIVIREYYYPYEKKKEQKKLSMAIYHLYKACIQF